MKTTSGKLKQGDKTRVAIKALQPRKRGASKAKTRTRSTAKKAPALKKAGLISRTEVGRAKTASQTMTAADRKVKGKISTLKKAKASKQAIQKATRKKAMTAARKVAGKAVKSVARKAGAIGAAYTIADEAISYYYRNKARKIANGGDIRMKKKGK